MNDRFREQFLTKLDDSNLNKFIEKLGAMSRYVSEEFKKRDYTHRYYARRKNKFAHANTKDPFLTST